MNIQAVLFGAVVLILACWSSHAQNCLDSAETCGESFGNTTSSLILTAAQESRDVDKEKMCKALDDWIDCFKTGCNIDTIPEAMLEPLKKLLKEHGVECDKMSTVTPVAPDATPCSSGAEDCCADPDGSMRCTDTFGTNIEQLLLTATQQSTDVDQEKACKEADDWIDCFKTACNIDTIPQARLETMKKLLKKRRIECDFSSTTGGTSRAATNSLLLVSAAMLVVTAFRQ